MRIRGQDASSHDIVNLYNFASSVRSKLETVDRFDMKMVYDWLVDFIRNVNKSTFPMELYNSVVGLINFIAQPGNLNYGGNINTISWQTVLKALDSIEADLVVVIEQMRRYSTSANGTLLTKISSVVDDYDGILPKSQFLDTTGGCDLNAVDPIYGDINEQFVDGDYVRQNEKNFEEDRQWIQSVTPGGQTAYHYNVAHGKQRSLDPDCVSSFRRGRLTVQIENENKYLKGYGCDRKDLRFARPGLITTSRNAPSINDYSGWKRTYA